ncbi:hypothetical protein LTR08_000774 [Meristemomyces frigidus]|nr:hypothetical protein LTR08_000774 [Meristemomyces frigidus]
MTSRPVPPPPKRSQNIALSTKTPCQIHPSAIIADKAQITGDYTVEIGENAVIHPYAKIRADGGRVVIGKNSMVYERAVIGVAEGAGQDVVVGDGVNIETGAVVEAKIVGDGSIVDVHAVVARGAVLGIYCKIAPMERVEAGEELPAFTVVHSDGQRRMDRTMRDHADIRDAKRVGQDKSIELMRKLIPNAAAKWM